MLTRMLRELTKGQNLRFIRSNGKIKALVGYKNPPVEHQFKKGNPGGPGRPKGARSLVPYIREELFKNDGENAKVIAKKLVSDASWGWEKSIKLILELTTPRRSR